MTNEEIAFEKINDLIDDCNDGKYIKGTDCDCIQYPCRLHVVKNTILENTKLKAEIEQLKEEVNANKCWSDVVEKTLKKEIDKNLELKSELEQSVKEKSEVISKIEYALNECEPIYNKCAVIPQAKPIYDLAMNYCLDLLKGQV